MSSDDNTLRQDARVIGLVESTSTLVSEFLT